MTEQGLLACLFDGTIATDPSADRPTWDGDIANLRGFHTLEPDWDGQRAIPPQPALIDSAIELACWLRDQQAPAPQFAIAGVNGTICFEWVAWHHHDLSVEVVAVGEADVFLQLGDGPEMTFPTLRW